ncbi:fungal-specific transcription factor domain-containing protein [Emericellopsis atlantica]|uniref:Fungal-specific transcription factor domain-containing protein n=1 Tax=Emericellopsis atlantica TaxID=2614577 RepID=A0A9P7ZF37_9HYPO|nr:fungal-specific transcription factor domain-containing protein [Emericellopsis atlantica]KAG9250984.1 fungal-specific transcription factor domain-containing protein [Emericellopsis atlantica]
MKIERRPVCQRCAQIKQACDGHIPCSRCTRLSLPCQSRSTTDHGGPASPSGPNLPTEMPKARIHRVQTGCAMCKQRKKKCDEAKPKCGDCRRLCLDCCWPAEKPKDRGGRAKETKARRAPQKADSTCSAGIAVVAPISMALWTPSTTAGSDTDTSPSSGMTHPFGVMAVRQQSPMLDPSAAANHDFQDSRAPDIAYDRRSDTLTAVVTSFSPPGSPNNSLSIHVPQSFPRLRDTQDRVLLDHYLRVVSPLLSRRSSPASNPYLHYLLPMADSNELVLQCILALSGNHWRKMLPHMGHRGLLHQSRATQALAWLLPHVDKTSADIALVGSLLLCMTELFDGTSVGWQPHLRGAKRLLAALRQHYGDLSSGQYKFLLRLSRFLDSAATVATCRAPLLGEEARNAEALESLDLVADAEDSAVYGIPKELFHLVDLVNILADKRSTRVSAESEAIFRGEANRVEEKINQWSYDHGGLHRAVHNLAPNEADALHATLAFEHALRLRLHQVVEGYAQDSPKVVHAVNSILDCVQKIHYGRPLEPCLLFPLVMAGGACWSLEQRTVILDRLMVMERTCGFGYVYNARDLVERVWARRDDGGGAEVNWAKIRYEEMHGLVVF